LIVDDRGVVCSRHEVLSNGCCATEQRQTPKNEALSMARKEKYCCKTCNPQGCCTIYEYCVSCCLHPDKVSFYWFHKIVFCYIFKAMYLNHVKV